MNFENVFSGSVILITTKRMGDERGWFSEIFREDLFRSAVGEFDFVQHNQSHSRHRGTVRGLHFQLEPHAQGKLVRCLRGRVLDVAVDLRTSSPTFGRHVAIELSPDNGRQIWVPPGFAHGFCTLEDDSELAYMVTAYYSPEHDRGLRWNDPALGIDWLIGEADAVLSPKDKVQPLLAELGPVFA